MILRKIDICRLEIKGTNLRQEAIKYFVILFIGLKLFLLGSFLFLSWTREILRSKKFPLARRQIPDAYIHNYDVYNLRGGNLRLVCRRRRMFDGSYSRRYFNYFRGL